MVITAESFENPPPSSLDQGAHDRVKAVTSVRDKKRRSSRQAQAQTQEASSVVQKKAVVEEQKKTVVVGVGKDPQGNTRVENVGAYLTEEQRREVSKLTSDKGRLSVSELNRSERINERGDREVSQKVSFSYQDKREVKPSSSESVSVVNELNTPSVSGGVIEAEKKPDGVFNKIEYFLSKQKEKLISSSEKKGFKQESSFGEGAGLFALGVASGVYNTVKLVVRPDKTIKDLYSFGKGVVKDPSLIGTTVKGVGLEFTRNPSGFIGEVVGSLGAFKGLSATAKAGNQFVKNTVQAVKTKKKYEGRVVVAGSKDLVEVSKGVSIEGKPVVGAEYIGTREELYKFTVEEGMITPKYGKNVDLRSVTKPDLVVADVKVSQKIDSIIPTNKEGLIKKPTNAVIAKNYKTVIESRDVPVEVTVIKSNFRDGGRLGVKLGEKGSVSYQSYEFPKTETFNEFLRIADKSKRTIVENSKVVDQSIKDIFGDVGVVEIRVGGKTTTVIYDKASMSPIAEIKQGSGVFKVTNVKPSFDGVVEASKSKGVVGGSVGSSFVVGGTVVDAGNGLLLKQKFQSQAQKTVSSLKTETVSQSVAPLQSKDVSKSQTSSKTFENSFLIKNKFVESVKKSSKTTSSSSAKKSSSKFSYVSSTDIKNSLDSLNKKDSLVENIVDQTQAQSSVFQSSQAQSSSNAKRSSFARPVLFKAQVLSQKNFLKPVVVPEFKAVDSVGGVGGFDVYVRERGVFKKISKTSLNKRDALDLGAYNVANTPRATFTLKQSSSLIGRGSRKVRGSFSAFKSNFKMKGSLFIEKREKRIKSGGEKAGITLKGILANKNKNIKGFKL